MIQPLGDIRHHFWLSQSMAKAAGVDLTEALHDGRINQQIWADAVTRCRACRLAEDCARRLSPQGESCHGVPAECANAALFQRLAG